MKCYKKLDIPNHQSISNKLNEFVINKTRILQKKIFWTYVNVPQIFQFIPELKAITDSYAIDVAAMAVVYAPPGLEGAVHIDYAKDTRILWPVKNCHGSYTRFFNIDPEYIEVARLENNEPYYKITQVEPYDVIDELELTEPVVFDSSIAHGVYTNPNCLEPRLTFTIRSKESLSHLLNQDR
jgi:hypothetical protein